MTEKNRGYDKIKELNDGSKRVKATPERGLKYQWIDAGTMHPKVYADALFSTNDDLSSQLGFIILLADHA